MNATVRCAAGALLAWALLAGAEAQELELIETQECNYQVGDQVSVEVSGAPTDAELRWADGEVESDVTDGVFDHTYGGPIEADIELVDLGSGGVVGDVFVRVYEVVLTPTPETVSLGEQVSVEIDVAPEPFLISDGATLAWGDGDTTEAFDPGTFTHTYEAAGIYTLELTQAFEPFCRFATTTVDVVAPDLTVSPGTPVVDQPVTATVTPEPSSGEIVWGDGEATPLDGSGSYEHAFTAAGPYTVELRSDGDLVDEADVEVLDPQLDLDVAEAELGETVTATVTDAPQDADIAWGDGAVDAGVGDGTVGHFYTSPGTFGVELIDATRGVVVASASVTIVEGEGAGQLDVLGAQQCRFQVGDQVSVEVSEAPSDTELRWGDGDVQAGIADGVFDHTYDGPIEADIELVDLGSGEVVDDASVSIYEVLLTPGADPLTLGEQLSVELALAPNEDLVSDGATLDWGDGTTTQVMAAGAFTHRYEAPGPYTVELFTDVETVCSYVSADVDVVAPGLTVFPAAPVVGQEVTATLDDEPAGGEIAWGDGEVTPLDGSGSYEHAFTAPAPYTVELRAGGEVVEVREVEVLDPQLELDVAEAQLGQTVTATVTDAPQSAEIAWGDGTFASGVSDGPVEHTYTVPGPMEVELIDAQRGVTVATASVTIVDVDEVIEVDEVVYDATTGLIEVTYVLSDLAPGVDYELDVGVRVVPLRDALSEETVTATYDREQAFEAVLTMQATNEVRASTFVELAWPRAAETLTVVDDAPHVAGDLVELEATGLDPDYRYRLAFDDPAGFVRTIEGESAWSERAYYAASMLAEPTLSVQYPGLGSDWEVRDSALIDVRAPGGAIALENAQIPFGREVAIEASDLIPDRAYRIDFGDGEAETFDAFSETETFRHAYTELPGPIVLEGYVHGADLWEQRDVAEATGLEFTGSVAPEGGGTSAGATQTLVATDLAPGHTYVIGVSAGTATQGGSDWVSMVEDEVVADEDGEAEVELTIPEDELQEERPTQLYATLGIEFEGASDLPPFAVTNMAVPPLQRTLGSFVVEVTEVQQPFTIEDWRDGSFDAHGVVRDMTVGAKVQGDVGFTFDGRDRAALREPLEWSAPSRLQGLELTFDEITLVRNLLGDPPSFSGTGTLAGSALTFDSDGEGLYANILHEQGEFLMLARFEGAMDVGDTGWIVGPASDRGSVMLDLAPSARYQVVDAPENFRLEDAYAAWEHVDQDPIVDPGSDAWMGATFLPQQSVVQRDPETTIAAGSGVFLDPPNSRMAVAWSGGGFHMSYTGNEGAYEHDGWEAEMISPYRLAFVASQIVHEAPAFVRVDVPFFGKPYALELLPLDTEDDRRVTVASAPPIARDFGMTAVIADQPRFEVRQDGVGELVFDRAAWVLSDDLAADGANLDATLASSMQDDASSGGDLPSEVQDALDDSLATLDTAQNAMRLQLPMDGLTVVPPNADEPEGGVSMEGETWATLAATPGMDFYGFPYMSGASAEIGVRRADDGDGFALGLRGDLSLGGLVRAEAAPSWYHVEDGQETRWVFEGVSAAMGDPQGVVEMPATFSLTVGGLVSLEDGDDSVEFNGAGDMTVGFGGSGSSNLISLEVAGVFGINDTTADETPYWFVYAGSDLADMGRPIPVRVQGVPVFAFYAFRGGVGHNLRLDQRTGNEENATCAAGDGFVGTSPDARPSVVSNALECFDDDNDLALLAGTLIGSFESRAAEDLYGFIWHLNTNLTINSSGQVILGGRGWAMKNLDAGYRADTTPNLMARLSADENAILGSFCVGDVGQSVGELDCNSLDPLELSAGGFTLLDITANAELKASWSTGEYYFAVGRQDNPVSIYVFPQQTTGYFVAGHVTSPGVIEGDVPASGVWASMYQGHDYAWSYGFDAGVCTVEAYAMAYFEFGGAIAMEFEPDVQFDGTVSAAAGASAGLSGCELDASVGVDMQASGSLAAPDPFEFSGSVQVTADLPLVGDVDVTVPDVTLSL